MGNFLSQDVLIEYPITSRKTSMLGWKPDLPDSRDKWYRNYKLASLEEVQVPSSIDLRNKFMPEVYDQGHLGSCTANAVLGAFCYDNNKQSLPIFDGSRLFLYWNSRYIEGTVNQDSGATLRDTIKVTNKIGVCPEIDFPYDIGKFAERPIQKDFTDAAKHKNTNYMRVIIDVDQFKKVLNDGFPVIFGFSVRNSFFQTSETGIMPIPDSDEAIIGGHAVVAIGYDNSKDAFLVRNSWNANWGPMGGYFWMPYSFITDENCADAWVIELVNDAELTETTKTGQTETTKTGQNRNNKNRTNRNRTGLNEYVS